MNAKRVDDKTPLDYAESKTADLVRKHGGKHGSIHTAAAGGDTEAVKEFLAAGTDVNTTDRYRKTPLDMAIKRKHPEIADLLRKHGGKTKKELEAEGK